MLGFWDNSGSDYIYITGASYCWSFWKRNASYSGACIRVRRSSDNTELDIGFGANNFLDVAALQTFVGSNTAWLVKWYEQFSGNSAFDFYPQYNGNYGYHPRIITSGVLSTFLNGHAAIDFNSGSSYGFCMLNSGSGTNMVAQYASTLYWSEESGSSLDQTVFGNNNENSRMAIRQISSTGGTSVFYDFGGKSNYYFNETKEIENGPLNDVAHGGDLYNSASYKISTQGARLVAAIGVGYNALGTGFSAGGRWSNETAYFRGKMNEILIYNGITHTEPECKAIQSTLNLTHQFYSQSNMSKDLVLWYDAGNSVSYPGTGTAITDLSLGGASGTLTNGVTYSATDGGKFVLDGVNDWIGTTGTNGNYPWKVGGGDYSVEVWIKHANVNRSDHIFGNKGTNGGMWVLAGGINTSYNVVSGKKIAVAILNSDNSKGLAYQTTSDIIDGTWKHIIVTRSSNTINIYVNGVDQSLTAIDTTGGTNHRYINSATSWRVADAGSGTGGAGAFDISIMRLYKCQLTSAQVTRNFNLEKARYGL